MDNTSGNNLTAFLYFMFVLMIGVIICLDSIEIKNIAVFF